MENDDAETLKNSLADGKHCKEGNRWNHWRIIYGLMIGYKAAGDTTHQPRCKQVDACLKALPDRRPGHRRTGGYLEKRDETSRLFLSLLSSASAWVSRNLPALETRTDQRLHRQLERQILPRARSLKTAAGALPAGGHTPPPGQTAAPSACIPLQSPLLYRRTSATSVHDDVPARRG